MQIQISDGANKQLARIAAGAFGAIVLKLIQSYVSGVSREGSSREQRERSRLSRELVTDFASPSFVKLLAGLRRDERGAPRVTSLLARTGESAIGLMMVCFEDEHTLTIVHIEAFKVPFKDIKRSLQVGSPKKLAAHRAKEPNARLETSTYVPAAIAPSKRKEPDPAYFEVPVWFGTNRTLLHTAAPDAPVPGSGLRSRFGFDVGDKLHLGRCFVRVGSDRPKGGLNWALLREIMGLKGDDVGFLRDEELESGAFWDGLAQEVRNNPSGGRSALIFVHGYCNTFESAAETAAVLSVDACRGTSSVAMFSWPSLGTTEDYVADFTSVRRSVDLFEGFVRDFATRSGASKIHILGHSMGAELVLLTLSQMRHASDATTLTIENLIFASPDVDSDVFVSLLGKLPVKPNRRTLYVSEQDKALKVSKSLHRHSRAGLAPPTTTADGLDTVNVAKVDLSSNGHRSLREAPEVLDDLFLLTRHGHPPAERGLDRVTSAEHQDTWRIRPVRRR